MYQYFAEILRQPGEELEPQQAMLLANCWFDAAVDFTRSEGSLDRLSTLCGSPGEFMTGADRLCCWLIKKGYDAYPLWDAAIAVEGAMDAGENADFKSAGNLVDRAMLVMRITQIAAHSGESTEPLPTKRLSRNDERDRWMVERSDAGWTNTDIMDELKRNSKWDQIWTVQGISNAVNNYRRKLGSE